MRAFGFSLAQLWFKSTTAITGGRPNFFQEIAPHNFVARLLVFCWCDSFDKYKLIRYIQIIIPLIVSLLVAVSTWR